MDIKCKELSPSWSAILDFIEHCPIKYRDSRGAITGTDAKRAKQFWKRVDRKEG